MLIDAKIYIILMHFYNDIILNSFFRLSIYVNQVEISFVTIKHMRVVTKYISDDVDLI